VGTRYTRKFGFSDATPPMRTCLQIGRATLALTFPLMAPTMCRLWPRRPNPWGKLFPITASSAGSAAGAWASSTRRKT